MPPTMTRTKNKTATQTQVIALGVLGIAAAAAFGYIGYSLPRSMSQSTGSSVSVREVPPPPPPGYIPLGYQLKPYNPPGYNPPGYNPPGYNPVWTPPGYSLVGKPAVAKFPCSYLGWDVTPGTTALAKVAKSSVMKGSNSALYWYGADGKRYVFPNEAIYRSWYPPGLCPVITTVSNADLAKVSIGGSVTYRPGSRLIKIASDQTIFAVSKGGVVRPFASQALIPLMYGANWTFTSLDNIPDAFFVNYTMGAAITSMQDYDPTAQMAGATTIDIDKGL